VSDPRDDYDAQLGRSPLASERVVRAAASALWGFGLLQLLLWQAWVAFVVLMLLMTHFVDGDKTLDDLWRTISGRPAVWLSLFGWPVATASTIAVIHGANGMRRFQRYGWAVTAAVLTLASIPVICLVPIQVPLGIWAIIVLLRRDVRARFEAVARSRTSDIVPSTEPQTPP
jgi:hypothetical protein